MAPTVPFAVPARFAEGQRRYEGAAGAAFVAAVPAMVARRLERWSLRPEGRVRHGVAALVLPVRTADGERAVLKVQLRTEETADEGAALRAWDGDGAVRVLREDVETVGNGGGVGRPGPEVSWLLLERLDEARDLNSLPDVRAALRPLAALLARLTAVRAPAGLRRLDDVADNLLVRAAEAAPRDEATRALIADCAAALRDVRTEGPAGERLLHWDLHYGNVLAAHRAPWLAIDPKPLAGDPAFDLLPALTNRYDPTDTARRFAVLAEAVGADRERAAAWTRGRVLQTVLWEVEAGREVARMWGEVAGAVGR
ncbi:MULTISPECIES: aminoglycoside phosphotransferase family protein [unclassified Streptomyces]|uniref:aminoglycoside phosphotransferase family protein n=1 Tax=unclassified Streptomyces TaxID=2593676 RepID=UPI000690FE52|nr:aminoglycoside phosphotransferase family protein [Streptomyces sp. NRRL F-5630]